MPETHGGVQGRRFKWQYDPGTARVIVTGEGQDVHTFDVSDIQAILRSLHGRFGTNFFPLASDAQKLADGAERQGLGTAILDRRLDDVYHAQGAEYLGVILESCGYFEWNSRWHDVAWRLVERDFDADILVARLKRASGERTEGAPATKAVIQCCLNQKGGTLVWQERSVGFVAYPELCEGSDEILYCRPDDPIPGYSYSWRRGLAVYNRQGRNPDALSRAGDLFVPPAYRALVDHCGWENTFILSAGWGLVRSDYMLPRYDITFSTSADRHERRGRHDRYEDYNHLAEAGITEGDRVYFFGDGDHLALYYTLTRDVPGRKVIYHKATRPRREQGYVYISYDTMRSSDWHYGCVGDFIKGKLKQ